MRLPLPILRATMRWAVRPIYGPPVPITFQRWYGDLLAGPLRVPSSVVVTDVVLGGVPARRYVGPRGAEDAAVLWAHGGAFITGSYATTGSFAAHLALAAEVPVYLPNYRLAPEHPFPAAVDDLVAAAACVPERRLALGGDSAGGCLALLSAARIEPIALALVSPMVDLTLQSGESWTGSDPLIRASWGRLGVRSMFPSGLPEVPDPTVPAVIHVAEHERLRPEGEALAARIGAELVVIDRAWHDIHLQAGLLAEAARAVEALGASVVRLLATSA